MTSNLLRIPGRLTPDEHRRLVEKAEAAGVSLGTYVRRKLGLKPLPHGGKRQRPKKESDDV